jgi:anti-sigma28 factor (negative regulator of flagellin synthesis)
MTLRPGASVTGASSASDINRAKSSTSSAAAETTLPSDGIRISSGFETLSLLRANQAAKLARVAAAVESGTYQVDSAALGKSIVEDALS